ncbi:MAG TPA: FecR domain-containing protein, partial [Alphaproteobacteria bacterium]|nr:FecR domain-containing protein [Alphaproteobacteria bacterium]
MAVVGERRQSLNLEPETAPVGAGGPGPLAAASQSALPAITAAPSSILYAGAQSLTIPHGDFLLTAEFIREGGDLVLVGADGTTVLVRDFFAVESPPVLWTEGGARILPSLAGSLAGPAAPGQYAQAADEDSGDAIGRVETAAGNVTATRVDGTTVTLEAGTPVFQGDVIRTGSDASIGIVFIDNSTFALDEGGRMVLDEFVFDPAATEGTSAFSVVRGVFTFVSGQIAQSGPDAMTVKTPVMSIGIRGTTVAGQAAADGALNRVTLLSEGEIIVSNAAGARVMNVVNQTTQSTSFTEPLAIPSILQASQVQRIYGDAIEVLPPPPVVDQGPAAAGPAGPAAAASVAADGDEAEGDDEAGDEDGAGDEVGDEVADEEAEADEEEGEGEESEDATEGEDTEGEGPEGGPEGEGPEGGPEGEGPEGDPE